MLQNLLKNMLQHVELSIWFHVNISVLNGRYAKGCVLFIIAYHQNSDSPDDVALVIDHRFDFDISNLAEIVVKLNALNKIIFCKSWAMLSRWFNNFREMLENIPRSLVRLSENREKVNTFEIILSLSFDNQQHFLLLSRTDL